MNNGFATATIVVGAILVALAFSGLAHADTMFGNIPIVGNTANAQSPIGNCNLAVAHYDSTLGDCVYNTASLNQQAVNWYTNNPNTPANQNVLNKYQSYTVNGVQYDYNSPVGYSDYQGYNPAGSTDPYYYTNSYAVSSNGAPSILPSGFSSSSNSGSAYNSYGTGSYGSAIAVGSNPYANTGVDFSNAYLSSDSNTYTDSLNYNNVVDSYNTNTNNYISGYNGLGSVSPYNAYGSVGYGGYGTGYGSAYGSSYCVTCSYAGSSYNSWAAYVPTTQPSSYFYYWGN